MCRTENNAEKATEKSRTFKNNESGFHVVIYALAEKIVQS